MTLTVYDCGSARGRLPKEYESFRRSADAVGDLVRIVEVRSADDIPPGEAREIFLAGSFGALPVTEFEHVAVTEGSYPTDQEIVDYVDVPDGVLNVRRASVRPANEMESPCCACHVSR